LLGQQRHRRGVESGIYCVTKRTLDTGAHVGCIGAVLAPGDGGRHGDDRRITDRRARRRGLTSVTSGLTARN
jgi:hypothetical protein